MARVLIAGIGYRNLSDYSAGPLLCDTLALQTWPQQVVVEDLSYGPIAVAQRLDDEGPERRFERLIVVSAVARGRRPGTLTAYRWDNRLPAADVIQSAVTEAVTGVISMDNTLIVCRHLGALPNEVVVVELQPLLEEFGDHVSPAVGEALRAAATLVRRVAGEPTAAATLPVAPLGGLSASLERSL